MATNIFNRYVSKEDTARAQLPVCRSDSKTNRIGRLLPRKPSHLIPAGKPRGGLVLTLQRASPQGGRASILKRVPKRDMEWAAACRRSHRPTVLGTAAITGPSCSGHAPPKHELLRIARMATVAKFPDKAFANRKRHSLIHAWLVRPARAFATGCRPPKSDGGYHKPLERSRRNQTSPKTSFDFAWLIRRHKGMMAILAPNGSCRHERRSR